MWFWLLNNTNCYKFHEIRYILFLTYHEIKPCKRVIVYTLPSPALGGWKNTKDERMVEEHSFSSILGWVLIHIVQEILQSKSIGLRYKNIRFSFKEFDGWCFDLRVWEFHSEEFIILDILLNRPSTCFDTTLCPRK